MKKFILITIAALFSLSILSCGHLKRPFKKNPGKKKGHYKSLTLNDYRF